MSDAELAAFGKKWRRKARFLLDEDVDVALGQELLRQGFNCRTVRDMGIACQEDAAVLAAAKRDDRILITHNRDFLNDRSYPKHSNPGVVLLPQASGRAFWAATGAAITLVGWLRELHRGKKVEVGPDGSVTFHEHGRRVRYRLGKGEYALEWKDGLTD
ncbi:MAG TPA: DUF5615 family PIN-like protein [Vicinamibacteria bacterium]|nr:DUF5615 family PIN-like protein [Vicinamibacteria bacterium]